MFYIVFIVLPIVLVLGIAVVGRLEKRLVWPYGPMQERPPYPDASGYSIRWVREALQLGFVFLGWAPDAKGEKYKLTYGLLVSPERDCFVIVGVGTIMGISMRGTWIYSVDRDGRAIYTTDNQSAIEVDVTRLWKSRLVRAKSFTDLLQRHREMLRFSGFDAYRFTPGQEIAEFHRARQAHYEYLAKRGLIAYTDDTATCWQYTMWGALKFAALNYTIGMVRAVTFGRVLRLA
ncbi:MAG: hypothetical protein AMXMBFR82_03370 [Candidatus Hydrogenedentota bacterium]